MDTKIIAILAVAVVVVAAVAVVVVVNDGDNFNGVIYDGNGGKTLEGDKTTVSVTSTDVQEGNIFGVGDQRVGKPLITFITIITKHSYYTRMHMR